MTSNADWVSRSEFIALRWTAVKLTIAVRFAAYGPAGFESDEVRRKLTDKGLATVLAEALEAAKAKGLA